MHLRPTTAVDLPRCVTIHDEAFDDDEVINYLAPNRAKYFQSWRQRSLLTQYSRSHQPNAWSLVCVADADDSFADAGEILGYARWMRRASEADAVTDPWMHRQMNVLDRVESWLRWAELKWQETMYSNPAVCQAHRDAVMRTRTAFTGFAPVLAATHWYLEVLAVAPEYQRRGVARRLMTWGLQRTEAENQTRVAHGKAPVPVTLIATAPGLHLYRALGFKVVGWIDDSFLPVSAEGGAVTVWDPMHYWIQEIEYEKPMKRGVVEAVYVTGDMRKVPGSVLQEASTIHAISEA